MGSPSDRPPSIDRLARSLAHTGLPHAVLVGIAQQAVADGDVAAAEHRAVAFRRTLLTHVVNATGVLLHTNLGRAPVQHCQPARPSTVEFDLATGERGSRHRSVGQLFARLCGAEDAMVVNNNAAAVLLVMAALATGRDVAVARGESVEIGGGFRVPEVIAQSGARLVDVGTTNRTRLADYAAALRAPGADVALMLKVHPSNYEIVGFTAATAVADLAALGVPVVVDIGSGLIDATTPWLHGPTPAWLVAEPAARQTLEDGAALVTFSGDKLLGGPQAGIIVGRADLVARCAAHPLSRAVRCGGMVLAALQDLALRYLDRSAGTEIPFWRMVGVPVSDLRDRAARIGTETDRGEVVASESVPGAGAAPGTVIPSAALALPGDHLAALRAHDPPVIARVRQSHTLLDLRGVDPSDDAAITAAVRSLDDPSGQRR